MIVNLFKTIDPRSGGLSLAFSFMLVLWIDFCKAFGLGSTIDFVQTFLYWGVFALVILSIALLERDKKGSKMEGIHLIVFPVLLLFFPRIENAETTTLVLGFLLIFGQHIFSNAADPKKTTKNLLDSSIFISILAQFNGFYGFFYLLPLSTLIRNKQYDLKNILVLLLPVFLIPYTLTGIQLVLPPHWLAGLDRQVQGHLLELTQLTLGDILLMAVLFLALMGAIFKIPKAHEKLAFPRRAMAQIYMSFWLFFGVIQTLFGLYTSADRWLLTFVPAAYFIGLMMASIPSDRSKNAVLLGGLLAGVLFKVLDTGMVSFPWTV